MTRAVAVARVVAVAFPATALAKGKVSFEDAVPNRGSSSVTITTHGPSSFRVVLRVPTQGRAKLFLTGKRAPKGGPLIDTETYACEGAAGSYVCRASYEPLPKGTYTWRVTWSGRRAAHVQLTVRW